MRSWSGWGSGISRVSKSFKQRNKRHIFPDVPEALPAPVVDAHTHVYVPGDPEFVEGGDNAGTGLDGQPLTAAEQARRMDAAGVRHAITCACEIPTIDPMIAVAHADPTHFSAAIGIHPNDAALLCGFADPSPDGLTPGQDPWHREYTLDSAIAFVADRARDAEVVAIGETGLDYYRTAESGRAAQKAAFRAQIALAKDLNLPLQIHDREAHADCIEILKHDGAPERVLFHAFSGGPELAEVCAREGWYASFGGALTFPANEAIREALAMMPAELVLAETDAPYLTPVPWRGHPNAPYVVAYTVRAQAAVRGVDLAEWCGQIDANSRVFYGV